MAKTRVIIRNWPRYLLQWGVLGAIILFLTGVIKSAAPADPETYCPMGGIQAFVTYLVRGSLPCSMSSVQIMMGLALAAAVVLFSKLFCGYLCPIGTIEDLLIKLRKALHLKNFPIRNQSAIDKVLRIFKYILLFWIFYMTATASELFCKNLDPYYAVATGFKGEITMWMSITTLCLVLLGGLLVDNFWCRYICPLSAVSNTLKFWLWALALALFWWVLQLLDAKMDWWILLGAFCLMGYLLEILCGKPKLQILNIQRDSLRCNKCGACERECPNHIRIVDFPGRVTSVDCTLCQDCVAVCRPAALKVGVVPGGYKTFFNRILPAVLTVALAIAGIVLGNKKELPTIKETWGLYSADSLHTKLVDFSTLKTAKLEGLKQIHCYGSSKAFQAKLMKIKGVHGVKTFVRSHSAVILYNSTITDPEKVMKEIYVPSMFKMFTPDVTETPELRVLTIRTEHMPASNDVNLLGLEFKQKDSLIYGLASEWDCPLIVRMYVDPAFDKDEAWIKSVVEQPTLDLETPKGDIKSTPTGYDFVRLEEGEETISSEEFIRMMFKPFTAQFKKRVEAAQGKKQYVYEMSSDMFQKPLITRNMPFLSNHLSRNEGIIGVYIALNKKLEPSLQIRYFAPMTEKKLWELMTMPEWTITYSEDDVRTVPAKLVFKEKGIVYPYVEE